MCTAADHQNNPTIVADGAGGAMVTWSDNRSGENNGDIYAQHVLSSGAVDPAWPADGPTQPARLDLLDVTGRRVATREVGSLGRGGSVRITRVAVIE